MEKKNEDAIPLKVIQKRNFYTLKDGAFVFLYALIFALLIGLVFGYVSIMIAKAVHVEVPKDVDVITFLFEKHLWFAALDMLVTQVAFLGVFFAYHKINRISFRAVNLSVKKTNPVTALICVFVGVVCVLGFIWLIEGCFGHMFSSWHVDGNVPTLKIDNVGVFFLEILLTGIIPPICEELLFRGVVFQGLREKLSPISSVLLSGLLFALMHQSVIQFIYPFILGCVLSTVMLHTGNLIYPILIHMFNNCTTIVLSFLAEKGAIKLAFNVSWWGWLCAILLAGVTMLLLWVILKFYLRKTKSVACEKQGEANQTPSTMVGSLPLSLIVAMLLCVVLIVINAV